MEAANAYLREVYLPAFTDDVRGIRVMPQTVKVDEGSSASFEVVLATQPVGSVTLDLMTDATGTELTPDRLHFDATNWSRPRTVTVQARAVLSIRDVNRPPDHLPDENPMVAPAGMQGTHDEIGP